MAPIPQSDSVFERLMDCAGRHQAETEYAANLELCQHLQTFWAWRALNIAQQHAQLQQYLAGQQGPQGLLRDWGLYRSYERLIPPGVTPEAKILFIQDLQIIAAVAYSDLQPLDADSDLIWFLNIKSENAEKGGLSQNHQQDGWDGWYLHLTGDNFFR